MCLMVSEFGAKRSVFNDRLPRSQTLGGTCARRPEELRFMRRGEFLAAASVLFVAAAGDSVAHWDGDAPWSAPLGFTKREGYRRY